MAALVAVLLGSAFVQCACAQDVPTRTSAYWIATDHPGIFDDQVLGLVEKHAGLVVLNAPINSPDAHYRYAEIVRRLHALRPDLPVLMYAWPSRWNATERIGGITSRGLAGIDSFALRDVTGRPILLPGGRGGLVDIGTPAYRTWWLDRTVQMASATGTNGVLLDAAVRNLENGPPRVSRICQHSARACATFAAGMDSLITGLRRRLPGGTVAVNGLWDTRPGLFENQLKLLNLADAMAVEFFGYHEGRGTRAFDVEFLPILRLMQENPGKRFLVFGRSTADYRDYKEDFLWQRYLYCAYLLGSGPRTLFKYHQSFQVPARNARAGGLATYGDWEIPLGKPTSALGKVGGLYRRTYENALIVVNPQEGHTERLRLDGTYYSPEGNAFVGDAQVQAGEGLILLKSRPSRRPDIHFDLGSASSPARDWRWATTERDAGGFRYLRVVATPLPGDWEHDLLLDPVRSLTPPSKLTIKLRSPSRNGHAFIIAEVDDSNRKQGYVAIELKETSGRSPCEKSVPAEFRTPPPGGRMPIVACIRGVGSGSNWNTVTLDGPTLLNGSQYSFRRWYFARFSGDLDVATLDIK